MTSINSVTINFNSDLSSVPADPNAKAESPGQTTIVLTPEQAVALQSLFGSIVGTQDSSTTLTEPTGNPRISAADMAISTEDCSADVYAFMALFMKMAQQMRDTGRELRTSEMNAQVGALLSSADELKKSADFKLASGIVQGAFQIAGGAMQVGFSAASAANTIKASQLGKSSGEFTKKAADDKLSEGARRVYTEAATETADAAAVAGANAQKYGGYSQAAGSFTAGISGIVAASLTHTADLHDIESKKKEAEAKKHETGYSEANEVMSQMQDIIRDIRGAMKDMEQSRQETTRGIARNI